MSFYPDFISILHTRDKIWIKGHGRALGYSQQQKLGFEQQKHGFGLSIEFAFLFFRILLTKV